MENSILPLITAFYGNHETGDLSNNSVCPIYDADAERMSSQYDVGVYDDFCSTFLIPCVALFCLLLWLHYSKQKERTSDFKIAQLYLRFQICEEIYKNDARTNLLREFVSIFVARTLDEFIDEIHKTPLAGIKELEAELRKMRHSRFINNSHCANLFKYTDRIRLERGQLVFRVAATFVSYNSENTAMDPTRPDFEILNISHLNVPALLDIINNCRLFSSVRTYSDTIVDCYVDNVFRKEESDDCLNVAIGAFLNEIDDKLLPDKSHYQERLNGIAADSSMQNAVLQQDTRATIVERDDHNSIDIFILTDSYDDYGSAVHHKFGDSLGIVQSEAVVQRWNLYRRDDPDVASDLDDERDTHQMFRLLYLRFHVYEKKYKNDELSNLLQEFLSKFVEQRFETYIRDAGIQEMSIDGIRKLVDDLEELHPLNASPNNHWTSWFENIDCSRLEQGQLLFCTAVTFMSSESENTSMDPTNIDFKTMNITYLNVSALLDIIRNCTLFESIHEYVEKIVDAFVVSPGLNEDYMEQMKKAMGDFLDHIDDALLPNKADYHEKVKKCGKDKDTACTKRLQQDLEDPLYINWIKGTLTLKYLSEGVRAYILEIFTKFKLDLPDAGSHFDDEERLSEISKQVIYKHGKWQYTGSDCVECKTLFDKVLKNHRRLNRGAGLQNCKNLPIGGAWGIAKMYMPGTCRSSVTPEEADAQSLLQLIINCSLFPQTLVHIEMIIKMRNKIMHSPNLTFEKSDLKRLHESGEVFLDQTTKSTEIQDDKVREQLDTAKENIKKIITNEMKIETIQEKDAIKYQEDEMTKQFYRGDSLANVDEQNKLVLMQKLQLELEIKSLKLENKKLRWDYMKLVRNQSWF